MSQCFHRFVDGQCEFCGEKESDEMEEFGLSDVELDEKEFGGTLEAINFTAKKKERPELRKEFFSSFDHLHSTKALDTIVKVVGGPNASQATLVVWVGGNGKNTVCFSSSSAFVKNHCEKKFPDYEYLHNLRSVYGDSHHIHVEMHLLATRLYQYGTCKGDGVIVSKRCCPVCESVLKEFGVDILDDGQDLGLKQSYFDWRNPWSLLKEATKEELQYKQRATKAALAHSDSVTLYGCK